MVLAVTGDRVPETNKEINIFAAANTRLEASHVVDSFDTHANKMWSQTPDRVFANVRGELTACSTEQEESDVFVQVLNANRNIPSEQLQIPIIVDVQFATNNFNYENLERKMQIYVKLMRIIIKPRGHFSSFLVSWSSLWFDLLADTHRRQNTMQTNRFLMLQFVCFLSQHKKSCDKKFPSCTGHARVHASRVRFIFLKLVHLRVCQFCFFCVIRCSFSLHFYSLRNNEKLISRFAFNSFLVPFHVLPLDKSDCFFLFVQFTERLCEYRAVVEGQLEPEKAKVAAVGRHWRSRRSIKLTTLLGISKIAFAIIEVISIKNYVKIAAHQVHVHHDSMHVPAGGFRKLISTWISIKSKLMSEWITFRMNEANVS